LKLFHSGHLLLKLKEMATPKGKERPHVVAKSKPRRAARAQLIAKLLRTGASTAAVVEKLGLSSSHALRSEMAKLRRLFPKLLKRRRAVRREKALHAG